MAPTLALRLPEGLEPEDEEEEELFAALEEALSEESRDEGDEGTALADTNAASPPSGTTLGEAPVAAVVSAEEEKPQPDSSVADRPSKASKTELELPELELSSKTHGLVCWPIEVRICVVSFLPWQELVSHAKMCRAWRALELEDVLWQVFFTTTWPRWTRRQQANDERGMPWRSLFRTRWAKCKHTEDALEEDWLDFSAAQDLTTRTPAASQSSGAGTSAAASEPSPQEVQRAVRRCREELRKAKGVAVPTEAVRGHFCSRACRFHRLSVEGDFFLCEGSGALHRCRDGQPCDLCVNDDEQCNLVCPVSGRCFGYLRANTADAEQQAGESAAAPTWDPDLSMTEQYGRWFEQGYFMSEDQAKALFGIGDGRRVGRRSSACRA